MSSAKPSKLSTPKTYPCPRCGAPAAWQDNPFRPFCSERCKMIDLGQWASGSYSIPGEAASQSGDDDGDTTADSDTSESS